MNNLVIGLAQLSVVRGDISKNLERHCQLIKAAAEQNVNVLLFPELSLTGYEPSLAKKLAINLDDTRLLMLQELADLYDMTLLVGAPKNTGHKPEIGLFIFRPNTVISCYSKMNLHSGEEVFFARAKEHKILELNNQTIGLAICADITNPQHIGSMLQYELNLYLASVLFSVNGLSGDCQILRNYAIEHKIVIGMSNYIGETGGWQCAGNSTIWDVNGDVIACAGEKDLTLVIAQLVNWQWSGKSICLSHYKV